MKKIMRNIITIASVLFVASCASTMQTASITEAYKKFEAQKFKQALILISRAENTKEMLPEMKAELTYLKAMTYENLGRSKKASALYKYLKEQHVNSPYSYLADMQLKKLS